MSWLLEGSSAGGFLGCRYLSVNGVLRIQAKVWECQILGLAWLDSFSGIQRVSILLAAVNVCSHWQSKGILFPPASLPHLLPADVTLAIVSVAIYFPIVLLIGIPEALRDAEHLVWWGDLSVIIPFFIFSLEVVRTSYLCAWLPEHQLFLQFFSSSSGHRTFLEGSCL